MSLKDKIRQYGIEIEYPLNFNKDDYEYDGWHDELDTIFGSAVSTYNIHADGLGLEFATPEPMDLVDTLAEVGNIYNLIDKVTDPTFDKSKGLKLSKKENGFNHCDSGIHIRLDVSDWTQQEVLRFGRLFSDRLFEYDDYALRNAYREFMHENFKRPLDQFNNQIRYDDYYSRVRCLTVGYATEKFRYVKYELGRYGRNVNTLEVRVFGVPEDVNEISHMFGFIHLLCDVVDLSLTYNGTASIDKKLMNAWNVLYNDKQADPDCLLTTIE